MIFSADDTTGSFIASTSEDLRTTSCRGETRRTRRGAGLPEPDHAIQRRGPFKPDAHGVGLHAAERRVGKIAEHLVIVDSDNRNLLRYRQFCRRTCVQHLSAPVVVAGQNPYWFWQPFQPRRQLLQMP